MATRSRAGVLSSHPHLNKEASILTRSERSGSWGNWPERVLSTLAKPEELLMHPWRLKKHTAYSVTWKEGTGLHVCSLR